MAAPLADLADLEAHLGRTVDPVIGDAALTNASGLVRAWCGWVISRETAVTFVADGSGTAVLDLPTLYLVDVTEVLLDGVFLPPGVNGSGGYQWSHCGQLYRACGWPASPRAVQALVDHGYDPVPDAITAVTVSLAGRAVENPANVRREAVGTVIREFHNLTSAEGLTALNMAVLGPFRLPMQP